MIVGSVGKPAIPYRLTYSARRERRLLACFGAHNAEAEFERDELARYRSRPPNCWLSTLTRPFWLLPEGPGIFGPSKLFTLRWLILTNAFRLSLTLWSSRRLNLSL